MTSTLSFASTGSTGGIVPPYVLEAIEKSQALQVECTNPDGDISFSSTESTLTIGDRVIELECEAGNPVAKYPDASVKLWSCVEARGGDGRFGVEVATIGILPNVLARVSIEQIFPLQPQVIDTLLCK